MLILMRTSTALLVLSTMLVACSVRVRRSANVSNVERASIAYEDAVRRQDVNATAAFFGDSVLIMPADAPTITGRNAYTSFMRGMSGRLQLLDYRVTTRQVDSADDLAVESGVYRQTIKFGDMPERTFDTRYVHVWRPDASGEWKIVRAIYNHAAPLGR